MTTPSLANAIAIVRERYLPIGGSDGIRNGKRVGRFARRLFIGLVSMGAVVVFAADPQTQNTAPVLIGCAPDRWLHRHPAAAEGTARPISNCWPILDLHNLAPLVGGILAVILYMLFLSGLPSGDLFRTAADDGCRCGRLPKLMAQHGVAYQDYAKMLVWSFVASFGEVRDRLPLPDRRQRGLGRRNSDACCAKAAGDGGTRPVTMPSWLASAVHVGAEGRPS
jgi:hypothetical protein